MIKAFTYKNNFLTTGLFLVIGLIIVVFKSNGSIADFGNYYYASKLFIDGKFSIDDYSNLHHFNKQIASYGATDYFENYTPVPPFSILLYLPFVFLNCFKAKLLFNIISLLAFCFSFFRLTKHFKTNTSYLYVLPIVFIYPFYNNIIQGQSYFLITSLLIEVLIADENKKYLKSAVFLSLAICLKIFPVFVLVFFVLRKKYKALLYTILLFSMFQIVVIFFVGWSIVWHYYTDILPRLINNDIIGAYHFTNQSVYSLLLNLFSFDQIHNNHPLLNITWLVPLLEGVFASIVLLVLYLLRKMDGFLLFGMVLFGLVLIGRYNTTYSMLLLLPFAISLIRSDLAARSVVLLLLFLGLSAPLYKLSDCFIIMQYTRLVVLLIIYFILLTLMKPKIEIGSFVVTFVFVISFKFITFSNAKPSYFGIQNTKGVLYDYDLKNDSLFLKSTLGHLDCVEGFVLNENSSQNDSLFIKNNILYFKGKILDDSNDNKLKPFIYNDSSAIFMSDLNQGVGFYKLRTVCLN